MTEMLFDENVLLILLFLLGSFFIIKVLWKPFLRLFVSIVFFFRITKVVFWKHQCTECDRDFLPSKGKFFLLSLQEGDWVFLLFSSYNQVSR